MKPAPQALPPRHITVGAVKDRLGMDALAISVSTHDACRAVKEMMYDRQFVDLDSDKTASLLDLLIAAGQPEANPMFPGSGPMTEEKKNAVLSGEVLDSERP